jgi:hypothetical protein
MKFIDAAPHFGKKPSIKSGAFTLMLGVENDQKTLDMGELRGLVFHWSAGSHNLAWDGYHGGVAYDKAAQEAHVVRCLTWDQRGKHIWGRNSHYVGLSYFAGRDLVWGKGRRVLYPGPDPIVPAMTEALAVYAAEICAWKRIDPRGSHQAPAMRPQGDRLVATGATITVPNLADHADFAATDGYAADRGDVGPYKALLVPRILAVYDELKAGKRRFALEALLR